MNGSHMVIILNDIRSTLNVGAMFRTADAVSAAKIFLTGITATPTHPKVIKTSLGAENFVPWESEDDIDKLIIRLKKSGYQIVGLELHQSSVNFWGAEYGRKVALLVGNEVDGIPEKLINACDLVINIPMYGKKESLNVATAFGIAAYEILRHQNIAYK